MRDNSNQQRSERGSVLFLILLAVVLFAALSNAVTQSIRGGGKNASSEQYNLMASEFINYIALIQSTHTRLKLVEGYDQVWLTNAAPQTTTLYVGDTTFTGKAVGIFNATSVGGIAPNYFNNRFYLNNTTPSGVIMGVNYKRIYVNGVDYGTSAADEYLTTATLDANLCAAINQNLFNDPTIRSFGSSGPLGMSPASNYSGNGTFWRGGQTQNNATDNIPSAEGCFFDGGGANRYYKILTMK